MNIKRFLCLILSVVFFANALLVFASCKKDKDDPEIDAPGYGEPFENIDKTGFPEKVLLWEEYDSYDKDAREAYRKSFKNTIDFVRWYQEAYRVTGKAGSLSSKTDYMKDFDKTGFPTTILTLEEYSAADWRIQEDYLYSFKDSKKFFVWYNEAQRIYNEEQNYEEIGGDGNVDLS